MLGQLTGLGGNGRTKYVWNFLILSVAFLTGCGAVSFDGSSGGSGSGSASGSAGSNSTSGTHNGAGSGSGGPTNPQVIATTDPQATIVAQPCTIDTDCLVQFVLESPVADAFSFDWKTNDSAYGTQPPAGDPPYGQPGVQYVPTQGHVTFQPGQTVQKVYVQDINPDSTAISIGVILSNCVYNSAVGACSSFFPAN